MAGELQNGELLKIVFEKVTRIDENVKSLKEMNSDQEKRIRKLEQTQWRFLGGVTLLGILIGYAIRMV